MLFAAQMKNWYVFQALYIRAPKRKAAPPIRQDCIEKFSSNAQQIPVPSPPPTRHLQLHSNALIQTTILFTGSCDIKITRNQALRQGFCEFLLKLSSQNCSQNVSKPIFYMVFVQFSIFQKFLSRGINAPLLLAWKFFLSGLHS